MIRILLVEDNAVVRQMLGEIIDLEADFKIVGLAENGLIAYNQIKNGLQVDIVLADLNMPVMDGIRLTEILTQEYSTIKVIVMTMHTKAMYLDKSFAAGARGYLLKSGDVEELNSAIRKVNEGEIFIGNDIND